jgi:hypothetical protein
MRDPIISAVSARAALEGVAAAAAMTAAFVALAVWALRGRLREA